MRPELLPEERRLPRRRGASVAMWVTLVLLSLTLVTVTGIILYRPTILGVEAGDDLTATAVEISRTESALDVTAVYLNTFVDAIQMTGEALDERSSSLLQRGAELDQRETQSALNAIATQTAVAAANAQRATQAALEFENTQTAFDRMATQVELDYQGTQAALNRDATAVALGFATNAAPAEDVLTQTPTPTQNAIPLFDEGSSLGSTAAIWRFSDAVDWDLGSGGALVAQRTGAWLLTESTVFTDYELTLTLAQTANIATEFFVLLNIPENGDGFALRLSHNGTRITAAGLFAANLDQITGENGLFGMNLTAIRAVQVGQETGPELNLTISTRNGRVQVQEGGTVVLDISLDTPPPAGAVGVQIAAGSEVRLVTLLP